MFRDILPHRLRSRSIRLSKLSGTQPERHRGFVSQRDKDCPSFEFRLHEQSRRRIDIKKKKSVRRTGYAGVYAQMEIVVLRARKEERGRNEALACYTNTGVPQCCTGNVKVRLTGCLSSNYSLGQLVPARLRPHQQPGIVFGQVHAKTLPSPFYDETRHLQDVQTIKAERAYPDD